MARMPSPLHRAGGPRRDHHRHDHGLVPHPSLARLVPALGRHRRARPVRHAGDRAAGATSSTRSCTVRRRRCRGGSRSIASIASPRTRATTFPVATTALPPAVPVRVALRGDRRGRAAVARPATELAARARRPAPDLPHLVRRDALRPRVPAQRQLDVLRDPDRPDRVGRVHRSPASSACGTGTDPDGRRRRPIRSRPTTTTTTRR